MIERALGQISEYNAPYRATGELGLNRINEMLPYFSSPVSAEDIRNMPGYNFMVNQGIGAARQRFNVGGGGSNMDRAAQKFASDYTTSVALPALMQQKTTFSVDWRALLDIGQTAGRSAGAGVGRGYGCNRKPLRRAQARRWRRVRLARRMPTRAFWAARVTLCGCITC
jgi:hypothetical protein